MKNLLSRNQNIYRTDKELPGGTMSAVHFGPSDQPVSIVFLHANGFNGLAYRSILEPLGVHVIALDLRGHGLTTLPNDQTFSTFHAYAKDVIAYLKAYVPEKVILSGHSLGASTAILAAGMAPENISKVLAFDPIVLPLFVRTIMRSKMGRAYLKKNFPIAKSAGRRRDKFANKEAVYKRYAGKGPFKEFPDVALWDYISGGFVQDGDHVRLACRPEWEQYTYVAQCHNLKKAIKALPENSRIMITDFVKQGNWITPMRRARPDLQLEHYPDLDHFFPVINPDISIAALQEALGH